MEFLTPDKTIALTVGKEKITVKQKIIPDSLRAHKYVADYVRQGQPLKPCKPIGTAGKPLGVTVHNTPDIKVAAGTNAAEQYCRATYNGNMKGVVVHYYVWKSEIWQLLRLNERGWHAGDGSTRKKIARSGKTLNGNMDTVSIEAIGPSKETEGTTSLLCAWLCKEYRFSPLVDVYQHFDFSGKICPLYIRPHWSAFVGAVAGHMARPAQKKPVKDTPATLGNALREGDHVRIKEYGVPYFPGGTIIPDASWLRGKVMTVNGLDKKGNPPVPCARLAEIVSWCAVSNLEKAEDLK